MTTNEVKHLKIDKKYTFTLKDGREITRRASWLLGSKDGHWCVDPRKCEMVTDIKEV